MGLGKEAFMGEIPSWSSTFMWRGLDHMLDACGVTHEYGDVMKKLAGLKLLFEKLCILPCG